MVSLYVGITDYEWFRYLSALPSVHEVNFWQPRGRTNFKALQQGELFLFKLHAPQNYIVGGGVFAHADILPVSLAWDAFGMSNGAPSLLEMRKRIASEDCDDRHLAERLKIMAANLVAKLTTLKNFPANAPGIKTKTILCLRKSARSIAANVAKLRSLPRTRSTTIRLRGGSVSVAASYREWRCMPIWRTCRSPAGVARIGRDQG
jgi:hypothetical protein